MKRYEVRQEIDVINPRKMEGKIGHFTFAYRVYNLDDEDQKFDISAYGSWKEVEEMLKEVRGAYLVLCVSMTDHSGQTIYIGQPRDAWDSGIIGFCWMSKEEIVDLFGDLSQQSLEQAEKALEEEVRRYDNWRNGEIYEAVIYDEGGEICDQFGGFESEEEATEYAERLIADDYCD